MEAAEKVFEAIEHYRNELRTQIKAHESKLRELEVAVPQAEQKAKKRLDQIADDLRSEEARLQREIEPMREQKKNLDRQLSEGKIALEEFLSQRSGRIEREIGDKSIELNKIVKQVEAAEKRLTAIIDQIAQAKDNIARL